MLLYWHHFHANRARINTETDDDTIAGHFLHLLHGEQSDELRRRAVDVSLILYAEHEFNASTFAARVATSTLSDFYSAIVAAIGTLRGPLHGGANEAAMELISGFQTPDEAEAGILDMLAKRQLIMGFGHRVYKISDPRSDIIKGWSQKLSEGSSDKVLYESLNVLIRSCGGKRSCFRISIFTVPPLIICAAFRRQCSHPSSLCPGLPAGLRTSLSNEATTGSFARGQNTSVPSRNLSFR
jgi:hypothetical protein